MCFLFLVGSMSNRTLQEKSKIKIQILINILYLLIVPILTFTILLAWWFYPEPYELSREYISALGAYFSENGFPNTISSMIMTIGINACGFVTLIISMIYFYNPKLDFHNLKSFFNLLLTLGALGVAIPQDHSLLRIYHGIGAAVFIVFFGVLNSVTQLIRFGRKHHRPTHPVKQFDFYKDLTMVIIVILSVIVFIVSYILSKTTVILEMGIIARISQKAVLAVDCVAIFFLDVDDM